MKLHLKAFYNLLRSRPSGDKKPWQVEDLREASTGELFRRLQALGFAFDEETFTIYAETHEAPEELVSPGEDEAYLLFFELWRRLIPEKQSLSILGDELDYRIAHKAPLESMLLRLQEILNDLVDEGASPPEAFQMFSQYSAHDLESFLYDYISDLIDTENLLDAAEILDSFYPFFSEAIWFDFLRARILIPADPHEANIVLKSILDELGDDPDLDLLLELSAFLVHHGDPHLFHQSLRQAYNLLSIEEDFQEILAIAADYYQCLDMEKEAKEIQTLFAKRKKRNLAESLSRSDPDLTTFGNYLEDADWSKV